MQCAPRAQGLVSIKKGNRICAVALHPVATRYTAMNYLSFLRRVASVAESAARPVPNKMTVTGSGIGTGCGVGVGPTGPWVAVGGTGVTVGGSGVGVSTLTVSCAKTLIEAKTGRTSAPSNNATAMTTLR